MPTIIVGTNSYQTLAEADAYLDNLIHSASNWSFVGNDTKIRALITAFTDMSQLCLKENGVDIDPANAPAGIKAAQAELAYAYSQDPELTESNASGGTNTKRVKAGSAEVEFFRPQDGARFPTRVGNLLQPFLCAPSSGAVVGGAFGTGLNDRSSFDDCDRAPLSEGLA